MLRYPRFLALLLALGMEASSCSGKGTDDSLDDDTASGARSEGSTPGDCSDGLDNDGDGLFDCEDPDCDSIPDCQDETPATTVVGPHGGTLRAIPAGSFEMGCTPGQSDCEDDETPVRTTSLTQAFYIGETEVTQREYQAVMGDNPSGFSECGGDCPVEVVTWHMAAAFTNELSGAAGLMNCYECVGEGSNVACSVLVDPYACDGYRLPTEAEWERAARCGEDTLYAGSDAADDVGWFSSNSGGQTHPVASKAANSCGLYDMSGNVWEWVQDWYGEGQYESESGTNPVGAAASDNRCRRGGGWASETATFLRVSNRGYYEPSYRADGHGFRVARAIP